MPRLEWPEWGGNAGVTAWLVSLLPPVLVVSLLLAAQVLAHHGGLPVAGSNGSPPVSLTWEQEVQSDGYRIKFLSEPNEPEPGKPLRLVFEVQRSADGIYEGGLTPSLRFTRSRKEIQVPVPEIQGVTGYYETSTPFPTEGALRMSFEAQGRKGTIVAGFSKKRESHPYATLGRVAVGTISILTLFGSLTSIYKGRST